MEEVLAWSSSVLLFKQATCHIACARERVKHGIAAFKDGNIIAEMAKPLLSLGPSFGAGEFIARVERMTANNAQNEGFVLLACFGLSSAGRLPAMGKEALVAYTYIRIAHNVAMAIKLGGLRTAAYLSSDALAFYICSGAIIGV